MNLLSRGTKKVFVPRVMAVQLRVTSAIVQSPVPSVPTPYARIGTGLFTLGLWTLVAKSSLSRKR